MDYVLMAIACLGDLLSVKFKVINSDALYNQWKFGTIFNIDMDI